MDGDGGSPSGHGGDTHRRIRRRRCPPEALPAPRKCGHNPRFPGGHVAHRNQLRSGFITGARPKLTALTSAKARAIEHDAGPHPISRFRITQQGGRVGQTDGAAPIRDHGAEAGHLPGDAGGPVGVGKWVIRVTRVGSRVAKRARNQGRSASPKPSRFMPVLILM